jgi:N-acetylmuramic acid 6-phosphate etherase
LQLVRLINREDAAVTLAVKKAIPALAKFLRAVEPRFEPHPAANLLRAPGRLIYLGAGTSGRLGVMDASEAPPTFHVPVGRIVGIIAGVSSEGKEDDPWGARAQLRALRLHKDDSILGIAAGGTTPYVLGALDLAKALAPGCITGLLTCSPIRRPANCDHLIVLRTGPEVLTGSTRMKAGSATKMALNIISTALMVRAGRVHENLMVDMRATNGKLRDRAARVISTLTGLARGKAFNLLDEAEGSVKAAVAMHRLGLSLAQAQASLAKAGGQLATVLSGP